MKTIRETQKALQLEIDGVQFWIQKRWLREDGTLTAKGTESFEKAKATPTECPTKKPYFKVKCRDMRKISEHAIAVECFDGSKDVLPISQIRVNPIHDYILVPCWLAAKKDLQHSTQKVWCDE